LPIASPITLRREQGELHIVILVGIPPTKS
jgi:hypothetical protein